MGTPSRGRPVGDAQSSVSYIPGGVYIPVMMGGVTP